MNADRAHELLQRERERVERALSELAERDHEMQAEQREPGDRGSESLYQSEFDASLAEDVAQQLGALERAEARLAAGTYGLSIASGEPIPDDRLEALPTAERTVDEQDRHRSR